MSAASDLADVREAFENFRIIHRRWPATMEEVYGTNTREGPITEEYYKDPLSGAPFRCVTDKAIYYKVVPDNYEVAAENRYDPHRVLVMLPEPYRTDLWPFGEMRTIIMTFNGVAYVAPSEIIDMSHAKSP